MKATNVLGILLIVLGVFALAYQGIWYTDTEKIIDLGPIEAQTETRRMIPLPPIVGGAVLAAGVILLVASSRNRA
jgi:hypothetical protein